MPISTCIARQVLKFSKNCQLRTTTYDARGFRKEKTNQSATEKVNFEGIRNFATEHPNFASIDMYDR